MVPPQYLQLVRRLLSPRHLLTLIMLLETLVLRLFMPLPMLLETLLLLLMLLPLLHRCTS